MKDRIKNIFEKCKAENRSALVIFQSCGFPDMETSERMIISAIRAGADIIELGIPFSDPMADGVVIQEASQKALQNGVTLPKALAMAERIRKQYPEVGFILFSYFNVLLNYGLEALTKELVRIGIDGILAVDLPYEEKGELEPLCRQNHLHLIPLISPVTSLERAKMITRDATGFVYCVAVCGVTGVRNSLPPELTGWIHQLKSITDVPLAVGFGISNREMAHGIAQKANAIVVGSAVLKPFFKEKTSESAMQSATELVALLRSGLGHDAR